MFGNLEKDSSDEMSNWVMLISLNLMVVARYFLISFNNLQVQSPPFGGAGVSKSELFFAH